MSNITLKEYLMGREVANPISYVQETNALALLLIINKLYNDIKLPIKLTSGYRPASVNASVGGAKTSAHMTCEAIDLIDPYNHVGKMLKLNYKAYGPSNQDILSFYNLYLEDPDCTVSKIRPEQSWIHLQTRRPGSGNRVFRP